MNRMKLRKPMEDKMTIKRAFAAGLHRTGASKRYILLVYAVNLILAIILAVAVGRSISTSLGHSTRAEQLLRGFDDPWYRSYSVDAKGLAATFEPGVVGAGAVLKSLDAFLTGRMLQQNASVLVVGALYLLLWTFFAGGFIAIYADPENPSEFFHRAARFFPRILPLTVLGLVLYVLMFDYVLQWLGDAVKAMTRDTLDERVQFAYTVTKYALFWVILWFINMWFDYGKIALVTDDRKNPLGALAAAWRFVIGHFRGTYGLYLLVGVVAAVLLALYAWLAPGARQASYVLIFLAFLAGQVYLLARLTVRCLFLSSQTAMYGE